MLRARVLFLIGFVTFFTIIDLAFAEHWARVKRSDNGAKLYIDVESIHVRKPGYNQSWIKVAYPDGSSAFIKHEFECDTAKSRTMAYKRLDGNKRVVAEQDIVVFSNFEPFEPNTFAESAYRLTCFKLKGPMGGGG